MPLGQRGSSGCSWDHITTMLGILYVPSCDVLDIGVPKALWVNRNPIRHQGLSLAILDNPPPNDRIHVQWNLSTMVILGPRKVAVIER